MRLVHLDESEGKIEIEISRQNAEHLLDSLKMASNGYAPHLSRMDGKWDITLRIRDNAAHYASRGDKP